MTLAFVDAQTSVSQLLDAESYFIPEMAEVSLIQAHSQRAQYAMLHETSSLRSIMLGEYFRASLARWHNETDPSSLLTDKRAHPAYRQIVALAEEAIPLILKEIELRPSFIFMALHEITGENPIAGEHRGQLRPMIGDWLRWGTERGYKQ